MRSSRSNWPSVRPLVCTCLTALVLASACSPAEQEPDTAAQEPDVELTEGADTDEPGTVDEPADDSTAERTDLVIGFGADDYAASEANQKRFSYHPVQSNMCETLVTMTSDFQVAEGLATDWEYVGDNTFRFTLRDGVVFHDGRPLDVEAVKYTFDYTVDEPATSGRNFLTKESTRVVDERTVEVRPDRPNLRFLEQANHPALSILAPGSDPLADHRSQACTGPFKLGEYVQEEFLTVERFDEYWGQPALLDSITFRFLPDPSTRSLALQSGDVDLITDVDRTQVAQLEAAPGINVVRAPPGQVALFYIARRGPDGEEKVTGDPLVRRAIAHAMDRQAFIDGPLQGEGAPVNTVNPPAVLGDLAQQVQGIPHDKDEASRLLDEAGWTLAEGEPVRSRDGEPLTLTIVYDPRRISLTIAEFVQAELAEVGIDAKIDQLEFAAYRERINNGEYELDLSTPNQVDSNPAFLMALRWYSEADGANAEFIAPGSGTEFDRLIAAALQADDPAQVLELSAQAMHELIDVEVGAVPLAGTYRIYALADGVAGFEPHASQINQRWDTIHWAD